MTGGRNFDRRALLWIVFVAIVLFVSPVIQADIPSSGIRTDIEYGQAGGERLLLDASVPEGEGLHPVVIIVHGGGWVGGDKQDMRLFYASLSQAGFAWFSINYRLAPKHRWPACLDDVESAVRWVKAHAADYKGDSKRIALLGYSAGGHLACLTAIKEPVQAVVGIAPPTDHLADSTRRGGLSECLQKLFDRPQEIDEQARVLLQTISPINYVTSDLPPFLLVHGTADKSVLYEQSVAMQAKLKECSVPCELVTIDGAPHRITEWEKYDSKFIQKVVNWLVKTIGDPEPATAAETAAQSVITVSPDGTGDFTTVQAAVDAVPENNTKPIVIEIGPGTYKEKIVIPRSKRFVTFQGQDAKTTVFTYGLYAAVKDENGKEIGTFRTPSVTIEADDFTAENVTFENPAGDVGQAVAVAVIADRVIFRNCRFLGWQDTLLDQIGRHYYENCYIAGHCDFIFGGGTAFFEKCRIHCLDASYITAASTPEHQPYGYVFSNCTITGEPENAKTYLGRPWRDYANVIFLNTKMANVIRPAGWHNWSKPDREKTAYYAEYNSTGPGADPQERVPWSHQLTRDKAQKITIESVLAGSDGWNPLTGTVRSSLIVTPASMSEGDSIKKKIIDDLGDDAVYLFAGSKDVPQDGLYFAYSHNGLDWVDLGGPFFVSHIGPQKEFINPNLLRTPDGMFHLVWQTGVTDARGIGYACSSDLIHWSVQQCVDLVGEHDAYNATDPALFYDTVRQQVILTWASTLPGNYYQAYQEDVEDNPRLWYATTTDFNAFTPAKPFFEPGYSVKDAVIVKQSSGYALIHEDNRQRFQSLRVSIADSPRGPWSTPTDALPMTDCRHPAVLTVDDLNIVYVQSAGKETALATRDFKTWTDITAFISLPAEYHYDNLLKVDASVLQGLQKYRQEPIEPIHAPFAMPDLKRPVFPDHVVDIRQYGAVADGRTDNTKAFTRAIAACADAGGGRVSVPAGKWFTGPIHLKSNIDLHLEEDAEIIFSDRFEDYLPVVLVRVGGVELYNYSPLIYARDCENVAITGAGKLNGNAAAWWSMKGRETTAFFDMGAANVPVKDRVFGTPEAAIRPSFLCLFHCRNVLLEGFTIGSGPNWTIHPVYCENVIIRRVNVVTDGPNNDGIDPDSCKNVLIEYCRFDTGDDCVVLKSGYNEDGWRVGRPTENVIMRYCSSRRGHGGLVVGSEMSGNVRNVYMHDCTFEGTDRAIRIKSKRGRGGVVENVWARDLTLKNMRYEAVIFNMAYGADRKPLHSEKAPVFRNFDIRNLICDGASAAIRMQALEDAPIENVYFENITVASKEGVICENIKNIVFDGVSVTPQKGPVYRITNGCEVTIRQNTVPDKTGIFLEVSGAASSDIRIRQTDLPTGIEKIAFRDGATKDAVDIE